jgi:hypothetical protein
VLIAPDIVEGDPSPAVFDLLCNRTESIYHVSYHACPPELDDMAPAGTRRLVFTSLPALPGWSRKALQGIIYWIGHRRSLYDEYPLGESAFVAELCNLIFAHLNKPDVLRCEVQYRELAKGQELPPAVFGRRARADIVIMDGDEEDASPKFIIEVKRGCAPTREINADLRRLAEIARLTRGCRTMLFIVAEARRLDRFVTPEGQSVRGPFSIPDDAGHYRVRRTFKAAHAFKARDSAQYASLLEVYPHPSLRFKLKAKPKRKRTIRLKKS